MAGRGADGVLQIFASHAIGGVVGNLLTGLFADRAIAAYDGATVIAGGWLNHHWIQLGYQAADSVTGMSYSFVMTTLILWAMHFVPFCRMRCDETTEILGVDDAEMGEFAYDYVGIEAELGHAAGDARFSDNVAGEFNQGGGREPRHSMSRTHSNTHEKATPPVSAA
jgi:Amt family ammonium transporter